MNTPLAGDVKGFYLASAIALQGKSMFHSSAFNRYSLEASANHGTKSQFR